MKKRPDAPLILCDDYNVGKFIPVSFIPKLNWKITCSEFTEHPTVYLPRSITIVGRLGQYNIQINSQPYSYGVFKVECRSICFHYNLKTNDPEEAIYLTEKCLHDWAKKHCDFYNSVIEWIS